MDILIIEDEERIATLVKQGLEEHGYQATIAYDGISGKKLALQQEFDLIITDIILPKMDGLELCKEIRTRKPNVPIIMLTALGTTDDKVEGFDAGADDYLVKPFEFRELHARIRALLKRNNGNTGSQGFLLRYADITFNLHTMIVKRNDQEIALTPKELKLLQYMMEHPERVLSRSEIAENVWGTTFDTGTNFNKAYPALYYVNGRAVAGFCINCLFHFR